MKPEIKFNKNRPTDRIQIDPRVVIGMARVLPTSYSSVAGSSVYAYPESTGTSFANEWRGIHGGEPL